MQQQPSTRTSRRSWARAVGGAVTLAVFFAVPVLAILFLGASTSAQPQPASDLATPTEIVGSLTGDYLVLDKATAVPTRRPQPSSAEGDSAADGQQVEVRLNTWTFTTTPPTRHN